MLERAAASIDEIPRERRDLAALTVCVRPETAAIVKERIHKFREELTELCDADTQGLGGLPVQRAVVPSLGRPRGRIYEMSLRGLHALALAVLAAWAAAVLSGCDSTGVGNPAQVDLAVTADPSDPPAADGGVGDDGGTSSGSGDISTLESAVVVVTEIRLLPCSGGLPAVFRGPFAVDLVAGTILPARPQPVTVDDPDICGLEAPLGEARHPAALAGKSVFFKGTRPDGVEFLLYASVQGTLRVRARGDLMHVPPGGAHWVWGMRPQHWVMKDELASAPTVLIAGKPMVVIDIDRLPLVYDAIRRRIGGLSALYLDRNANHLLDADERTDSNVIGDGTPQIDP
jgi:hypothetical protein